mmetsp:Transcript_4092/g.9853  ORF Transcript_4092/g.9853 Transcript_4092/m.9853 type:complete len:147 (-) Transcript_4092:490-930(-)
MSNDSSSTIPPFHSLPFSAYYRTECQDKYCTSRLAYHVANDNECASSLLLTPCFDKDDDEHETGRSNSNGNNAASTIQRQARITKKPTFRPSYRCEAFVHGHQYSRKVRCFDQWVDAAGFVACTIDELRTTNAGGEHRHHRASSSQ